MRVRDLMFGRSGGYWLFWTSAIYLAVGMYCALYYKEIPTALIQLPWLFAMSAPLLIPPLGRWLNMNITWDRDMFNKWFGKKDKEQTNVVDFPAPKLVPPMPEVEPPKKEEPAKIYYRLGLTDNNRVAFSMGYSEITMNAEGCQQMIDQLTFFQSQLYNEDSPNDDPDGGLPIPVPEEKAA